MPLEEILMLEHLINETDLCERLGVTKATLQAWRQRGQGPAWIKLVGRIHYDRRRVDEWIAASERVPGARDSVAA
jgi:predicted site-specific integrase-resolvase